MSACPFCGRDPFHRVDNGLGMEAVAVDCCELGDQYFRGARPAPEQVTLSWDEFVEIGGKLARLPVLQAEKDGAYTERNQLVALLARLFPSGTKPTEIDGWDPEWHGCVYIDLPTGQASWHYHDDEATLFADLPPYKGDWDGHTTEEKYRRVAALARRRKP